MKRFVFTIACILMTLTMGAQSSLSKGAPANVEAVDLDSAPCRRQIAGDHVHCRGFSRTVRPEEPQDLSVTDLKADPLDGSVVPVIFCQILDLDHTGSSPFPLYDTVLPLRTVIYSMPYNNEREMNEI